MAGKKPLHDGHRERLRARFLRDGLGGFEDHQALELLLFFAIPRGDTNPIAHRLLQQFGSFSAVLNARKEELCRVEGVGENTATLLYLVPALCRRYLSDLDGNLDRLDTLQDAGRYLTSRLIGYPNEVMFLLCLDGRNRVIYSKELAEGTVDHVPVTVRSIVEVAIRCNAVSVILAHNHTQGFAIPSSADLYVTQQIKAALDSIGIELRDHIIVANDGFVSMMESHYL